MIGLAVRLALVRTNPVGPATCQPLAVRPCALATAVPLQQQNGYASAKLSA